MEEESLVKYIYQEEIYILDEPTILVEESENTAKDLVNASAKPEPSQLQEPEPLTHFGNNDKGILILVNDDKNRISQPGSTFLPDENNRKRVKVQ